MNTPEKSSSKCARCGKKRVVIKTYKKKVNGSEIIYRETGCPDLACQKELNKQLKKDKQRRKKIKDDQKAREEQRKKNSKKRLYKKIV